MEQEERKIAKAYAIVSLYTLGVLIAGIILGFTLCKSDRENTIPTETTQQVSSINIHK